MSTAPRPARNDAKLLVLLPTALKTKLEQQARHEQRSAAFLAREAIDEYLSRRATDQAA